MARRLALIWWTNGFPFNALFADTFDQGVLSWSRIVTTEALIMLCEEYIGCLYDCLHFLITISDLSGLDFIPE